MALMARMRDLIGVICERWLQFLCGFKGLLPGRAEAQPKRVFAGALSAEMSWPALFTPRQRWIVLSIIGPMPLVREKIMKKVSLLGVLLSTVFCCSIPAQLPPKGQAEHVVLILWDGMRPDFVTPQYTPNLYSMARKGVFFKNHHSTYISSTEVNGTAIATGVYPEHSGIYANSDYRPVLGWLNAGATEGLDSIRRADFMTGGRYLLAPTVAEILQKAGYPTVVAGAKPVALLHDRASTDQRAKGAAKDSIILFKGQTIPKSALDPLVKVNDDKAFPTNSTVPNKDIDAWTTKALTHGLWKKGVPKYSVLWLSDPDASQHSKGVGADESLTAIGNSDKCLENVLKALEEKKVLDQTDILVASDHGFSTIRRGQDVTEFLKKAKFKAVKKFEDPEPGEVLVVGHGGSVSLFVWDRDDDLVRKLVTYLQGADFVGVIFSRLDLPGTFPLEQVRIANTNVRPDIVFSVRWIDEKNDFGAPGLVVSEGGSKGGGTHASLSRYDMHNTLVASGPDFKKGLVNELPSGSIDIAPTTLWILGVPQPEGTHMDGRVLQEALLKGAAPEAKPETKTIHATQDLGWLRWSQYLKFTRLGDTLYFDEGNGSVEMK
ncbi:MAG: alkaline phosphatase family protein [Syntrophales bacterium LBB04]|nr:alkaline phosphatase family protein [Syntrophales bacterium LBB04]